MDSTNSSIRKRVFLTGVIAFSVLVFVWRVFLFGDMEPRGDQPFFTWWVLGMEASDHLLPYVDPGEKLFDAMARDETGFLTQFFRPMYNSPTELLKAVSILILYAAAEIFGATHYVQAFASILASVLLVGVVGLFFYGCRLAVDRTKNLNHDVLAGVAALVLGISSIEPVAAESVPRFTCFFK